ncbi:hypothetical protein K491DRAFT_687852 [Lophiostoma macrostomum CBS 122681]|uniref:Uncharacterized protein n=1 Tax=Lophiostoma macrostomum CBS 122681 TaxID=1314788 RepID=A0A6A6TNM4_9PLEO|nr:hypothetical protein K491DRAFT_687852 [Lophiostoma macrostomum CBS 122681]
MDATTQRGISMLVFTICVRIILQDALYTITWHRILQAARRIIYTIVIHSVDRRAVSEDHGRTAIYPGVVSSPAKSLRYDRRLTFYPSSQSSDDT